MADSDVLTTPYSRVFLIPNGANPGNGPVYKGIWKAGSVSWTQGDKTPVRNPSSRQRGAFDTVKKLQGEQGLPELPITARYTLDLSEMLEFIRAGNCTHDLQIHFGTCGNPKDFASGWEKVAILSAASISDYGTTDLGALEPGDDAIVNEEVTWQGENFFELKKLSATEIASSNISREMIAVAICDSPNCGGSCGTASNGCQKIYMVSLTVGTSPGLSGSVVYSADGGSTTSVTTIDSMPANEDPNDAACVGSNLVVISEDGESLHYADLDDIQDGVDSWTEVTTGFVSTKGPLAIYSLGPNETWIVGEGGYIYFTEDPTSGVEVQDAGVATAQNLLAVHAFDSQHAAAVGASNAVVRTTDGSTWGAITGPAVGVVLNTVWMKSADIWMIGTAGGALYYTNNGGTTWVSLGFPGSGSGAVTHIVFESNGKVGYMAHTTAAGRGRILRSIDGGNTWRVMPDNGSMPLADRFNKLATCAPNVVFGVGLADDAADGIAVKLS